MNKKSLSFLVGALSIIIAAILWSLDGTLIRPKFYTFSPINVVFLEHLLGAIVLSPFLFFGYKKIRKIKRKDFLSLLWVCLFGGLIGTLAITEAFFSAFRGEAIISTIIVLQKLQPIFALLLASIVLKEKLTKSFYIWAIIAILSAYFIAFGSLGESIFSIDILNIPAFYAILAAFAFGSSTVFGKTLVNDLGFKLASSLRFLITTILAFIILLLFGNFSDFGKLELLHWKLLGIIVFTSGAGALFLYYYGLRKVSASASTIFELAWPLSAILFDYIFNENILNSTQIIFSFVLIISFFMIIKEKKK
ncbi:EamA family transporter [Candidatus Gracilibacteria bacterium]|nr:MAG: EamA family transporter [Candidatus Gracilibacteria bacterium]PIE85669.1 MAG: EamA family transporter [Candidatus Gracilibacteria bacterium]